MTQTTLNIAIIGSGPSGCYTAQFLRKKWPMADITIFEALPAPYGLLRYGVATDHQGTKAISLQFDRLFERDNVRFAGNVTVGRDIALEKITENFDIVVRATGLEHDKIISVAGDGTAPVIGAGALLKAVNGYPHPSLPVDEKGKLVPLGENIALIGTGNVAMDVIRILGKSPEEFAGSDVDDERLKELNTQNIRNIHVLGRSSVNEAKFDYSMLKEVLSLSNINVSVKGIDTMDSCKNAQLFFDCLKKQEENESISTEGAVNINFYFGVVPQSLKRADSTNLMQVEHSTNNIISKFNVDTVISAIGFTNAQESNCADFPPAAHIFKVGWLNRDGKGAIAENRRDAKDVAEKIVQYVQSDNFFSATLGYDAVHPLIEGKVVTFDGWKKIDTHECTTALPMRCRKKVTDIALMLSIAARTTISAPA